MRRFFLCASVVCGVLFLVFLGIRCVPSGFTQKYLSFGTPTPTLDYRAHERLVAQDMKITHELQARQTILQLQQIAESLSNTIHVRPAIIAEKAKYAHIEQLVWLPRKPYHSPEIQAGELPAAVASQLQPLLAQAKETVKQGKLYQSASVGQGHATYAVVGLPSAFERSALVAVIHQDMLHQVKHHQHRSMRLQAYAHEQQSHIKTVEPQSADGAHPPSRGTNQEKSHYVEHEIIVRFKHEPSAQALAKIKQDITAREVKKTGYAYVFISKQMTTVALKQYFDKHDIVYAEPHFIYVTNVWHKLNPWRAQNSRTNGNGQADAQAPSDANEQSSWKVQFEPNDQFFAKYQWNLPQIATMRGWQFNRGAADLIVAVVDSGVDAQHPDLQGKLVAGQNMLQRDKPPEDDNGHGTHVAGIISALTNNDLGVAGMTWFNKVMPVKVLDQEGAGSTYHVAEGIIWATDHGAKVINLSLGNYADSAYLHDAIQYAYDHDVVLIAAGGNDNSDRPSYPAAYPEVCAVAASDAEKRKAPFSNIGDHMDLSAPGVSIASTYLHNEYAALSGTSMASPHVAALAALIRSANPSLKNKEVYDVMRNSAEDLGKTGKDVEFGYGLINVEQALAASLYPTAPLNTTKNPQSQSLCE